MYAIIPLDIVVYVVSLMFMCSFRRLFPGIPCVYLPVCDHQQERTMSRMESTSQSLIVTEILILNRTD